MYSFVFFPPHIRKSYLVSVFSDSRTDFLGFSLRPVTAYLWFFPFLIILSPQSGHQELKHTCTDTDICLLLTENDPYT